MFKVWCGFLAVAVALLLGGQAILGEGRRGNSSGGLHMPPPAQVSVTSSGPFGSR